MPCTYVYKRCRVSTDSSRANYYLTFKAKCKDCGVFLNGLADHKPVEGFPLPLNIETEDTTNCWEDHYSKRPLNGKKNDLMWENNYQKILLTIGKEVPFLLLNLVIIYLSMFTTNMSYGNTSSSLWITF